MNGIIIDSSNEIWINDFTDQNALTFREKIMKFSAVDENRPITIYINSYGGSLDAMASMIETMEEIPNPIITSVMGIAASAGAILFSFGDIKFIGKRSRLMIHDVSGWSGNNAHDMMADAKEIMRVNEYWLGAFAENSKIGTYADLKAIMQKNDGRDLYFNAEDAVNIGIANQIGAPKLHSLTVYQVSPSPDKKIAIDTEIKDVKKTKSSSKKTKSSSKKR